MKTVNDLANAVLDALFPPACLACSELLPKGSFGLCPECGKRFEEEKRETCRDCLYASEECRCRVALPRNQRRVFPAVPKDGLMQVHLVPYRKGTNGIGERMVLLAKDRKLTAFRTFIGKELRELLSFRLERWNREDILLTFIPRKPSKVRVFGTDQAKEIALGLGREVEIPVTPLLKRCGGGEQKKKNGKERMQSSAKNYRLKKNAADLVRGKTVWLCDDVLTSGASMLACASLLMQAGAKEVLCITVCRTAAQE